MVEGYLKFAVAALDVSWGHFCALVWFSGNAIFEALLLLHLLFFFHHTFYRCSLWRHKGHFMEFTNLKLEKKSDKIVNLKFNIVT